MSETGILIGVTVTDDGPANLYLLPGSFTGTWKQATEWAAKIGGTLPSRVDALVLFKRACAEFETDWYWTDEQTAADAEYAWSQIFFNGRQLGHLTYDKLRARAVRREPT